jgi:5-methylcytosine-specific restriction endonuclease McrA
MNRIIKAMKGVIDPYIRYQKGLVMEHLFPTKTDNTCACGCGNVLSGKKKKWYSKECMHNSLIRFLIIKGDIQVIRNELFKIDKGYCRSCGQYHEDWEADHILPVIRGGGGCTLDNFQTLCPECHKIKTSELYRIPYSHNILTTCLYIFPYSFNGDRTLNEAVGKDVIRNIVCVANNKPFRNDNIV